MTRKTDFVMTTCAAVVAAGVVISIIRDYRVIKNNKKLIQAKARTDIERIWKAAALVEAKVRQGDYDGKNIGDVMNDFQFYQQIIDS